MTERWLPVVGYEGLYEVSDLGRVRSVRRLGTDGRVLRLNSRNDFGHLAVSLSKKNKRSTQHVHTMVLTAFVGPCPEGKEACHYPDRDPANNCLINLRWDTRQGNAIDSIKHGTIATGIRHGRQTKPERTVRGERCHTAKLNPTSVKTVFDLFMAGMLKKRIAAEVGVSKSQITNILCGRAWKHLELYKGRV